MHSTKKDNTESIKDKDNKTITETILINIFDKDSDKGNANNMTDSVFNFDNDTKVANENNKDDMTISDSFLEQAITTHLFDDVFDLQEEVDKTDKETEKKQTENKKAEGEKEKKREEIIKMATPNKNCENNVNAANANQNVSLKISSWIYSTV